MWSNFPHSPCWQSLFGQVRTTKLPRDEQIVTCGDKLRTESLPLACRVTALWASVLVVLYVLAAHRRAGSELCGDAHQQALACLSRPSDVLQLHRHGLVHRLSGPTFSSFPEIHSPRRLGVVFFLAWKPMRRLSLGRPRVTGYAEMKVPPSPPRYQSVCWPASHTTLALQALPGLQGHGRPTSKTSSQEFNGS